MSANNIEWKQKNTHTHNRQQNEPDKNGICIKRVFRSE